MFRFRDRLLFIIGGSGGGRSGGGGEAGGGAGGRGEERGGAGGRGEEWGERRILVVSR